eukprot:8527439-Pyramimonas_sp.AAC.1
MESFTHGERARVARKAPRARASSRGSACAHAGRGRAMRRHCADVVRGVPGPGYPQPLCLGASRAPKLSETR